jgi:hypothetical protein
VGESGKTINLSTRAFFAHGTFSLDLIKLVNALCGQRLDWSLPWPSRLILLAFFALNLLPAALWAGAITPVTASQTTTDTIPLPLYKNVSWLQAASPPVKNEAQGIFTFNPGWYIQGLMLNSAASASSRTGGSVTHPKLDNTQYSYINRSYGVGASVGLTDGSLVDRTTAYTYYEHGFESSVSCIYNLSSAFHLYRSFGQPPEWLLQVYEAKGTLPNTEPGHGTDYVAATMGGNPAIVALTTDHGNGQNYIAITTNGEQYAPLNNTQCEITFTQRNFSVDVDVVNRTISVAALNETTWLPNKTVADMFNQQTVGVLYSISISLSTALYVNGFGNALMDNIDNVQATQGINNASTLAGIEAVLTSIMDDALVAFASAQMMLLRDTAPVSVVVTSSAYAFGTAPYIYAVVAITFVVTAVYVLEACRTRGWRGLSKFDFMDVKSVIIAASEGGTAIVKEAQALHQSRGTKWYADVHDGLVGRICVRLGKSVEGSIAVLLSERRPPRRVYTGLVSRSQGGESMVPLREMGQSMGESHIEEDRHVE